MDNNYWINFWRQKTANISGMSEQEQVLRTLNKSPIGSETWSFTLQDLNSKFKVMEGEIILDLCAGNGLFAKHFTSLSASVIAVDISENLLNNLRNEENITTIKKDIRDLDLEFNSIDKIFFYAGIQYLTKKETIDIFVKMHEWLKPGGEIYIGDIPDIGKKWSFYNTSERKSVYFRNIMEETPIIGTWFSRNWLKELSLFTGFKNIEVLEQHERLICSYYRFDFRCTK